jgi:signal transduction histidine kinase
VIRHMGDGTAHSPNPHCPLRDQLPDSHLLVHPLRFRDGPLGELCVARQHGAPFGDAERSLLGAFADMAAIAVRTARLGETEQQWTILSERDRIARELHDSLAQVLGHIHLRLRALEHRLDGAAPLIGTELSDLATVADEAYSDVREAILGLRETLSPETGLEGALREYLVKFSRQTGIATSLSCDAQARDQLPPRAEVQLLRVVQEALTNVRKHAQATRATVRIQQEDGTPVLIVEDDGVGFSPGTVIQSFTGGFGMTSMRERVEQVGGTLDVHTSVGGGTRIVVRLSSEGSSDASPGTFARALGR